MQKLHEPRHLPPHLVESQLALVSHLSGRRFGTGATEKEGHSPSGGGPATGEQEENKTWSNRRVGTGRDPQPS